MTVMTKKEFKNLKRGSVVTQNNQYFIVFETFDDEFINTQELSSIGHEDVFGFEHTYINYKYSKVVKDENVLRAIEYLTTNNKLEYCDPYSFILGCLFAKNI